MHKKLHFVWHLICVSMHYWRHEFLFAVLDTVWLQWISMAMVTKTWWWVLPFIIAKVLPTSTWIPRTKAFMRIIASNSNWLARRLREDLVSPWVTQVRVMLLRHQLQQGGDTNNFGWMQFIDQKLEKITRETGERAARDSHFLHNLDP